MEDGQEIPKPPQHDQKRSPFGDREQLREYIRKERQPVDYSRMVTPTTRVLALGEAHTREITKREVIDHIKQFRDLGFTHFGMEVFGTEAQPILDEYQKTGGRKEELMEHIRKGFGGWSPNAGELYLKAVDEAKRVGMRVVAIDLPMSEQEQYKSGGMDRGHKRDDRMSQTVQAILNENPEHKVVTLTGSGHAGKSDNEMAGLLAASGVEIVTAAILGGSPTRRTWFESSAIDVGVATERFMSACLAKFPDSRTPYDWIIHLPQVEAETGHERTIREADKRLEAITKREKPLRPRMDTPLTHPQGKALDLGTDTFYQALINASKKK